MFPLMSLLYGFLAGSAGLLLQTIFIVLVPTANPTHPGITFLLVAALIEEAMKFLFLFQRERRTQTPLTVLAMLWFGLGFALVEIGFFTFSTPATGWVTAAPSLGLNSLLHIATALLIGLGLRHFPKSSPALLMVLAIATLAHVIYNLFRLSIG